MRAFEKTDDFIRVKLFGERAKTLGISPNTLTGRRRDCGFSFIKLIYTCSDPLDVRRRIINYLKNCDCNDFFTFTLVIGLFFECFNCYNYIDISKNLLDKVICNMPNKRFTSNFLIKYYFPLFLYFKDTYGITKEEFNGILIKVASVNSSNDLYNNPVINDLGKILIASAASLRFDGCREALTLFDHLNSKKDNNKPLVKLLV